MTNPDQHQSDIDPVEHECEFRFYAELNDLLRPPQTSLTFPYRFHANPSVKDAIEALGVPHTEVDLILVNGQSVGFDYHLRPGDRISVYPVFESMNIANLTHLRPQPLRDPRFICDNHLGKLTRRLRLLGFDVISSQTDGGIVETALAEHRIIITRDRGILKQRAVTHGYLVRSDFVTEQVVEILNRFDLRGLIKPFSRCARCNGLVEPVEKNEIEHELLPLTREHYQAFFRCKQCKAIYWRGAHAAKLDSWIEGLA
jgi:uncharacterized protein with PIN domain